MNGDKKKSSFVIYRNWMELILRLPDDQALDLVRTMFSYCIGEAHEPGPVASAIFDSFKSVIDNDVESWERICEMRKEIGSRGGKAKASKSKQLVANGKQLVANGYQQLADNDNENDNDTENDNENDVSFRNSKKEDTDVSKKEILTDIINRWNSYTDRGDVSTVKTVSPTSKCGQSILARVKQYGEETVMDAIAEVFRSDYLTGKTGRWTVPFDWVFKPNNFEKIINGNYRNKKASTDRQADVLKDWMLSGEEDAWTQANSTVL